MRRCLLTVQILVVLFTTVALGQDREHLADAGRSSEAEKASSDLLRAKWESFFANQKASVPAARTLRESRFDTELPLPQRRQFALDSRAAFQQPFAATALDVTLTVAKTRKTIGSDPVFLRMYNGELVGPTLRVKRGQTLRVTLDNQLSPDTFGTGSHNTLHDFNTTNLHAHGLHVSPSGNADNVLEPVRAGTSRTYVYEIGPDHPSGTFWYHAHWHGAVAAQVSSSMAGALIVDGDNQDQVADLEDVPEIANATERILVLQQIPYYNENLPEGVIEPEFAGELFGPNDWDALQRFTTINGVRLPVISAQPGSVERWRLIDAGFREQIKLGIERVSGGGPQSVPLYEIAVDGLATGKRRALDAVELYPGYRADVLVKMPDAPGEYLLVDERNITNPLVGPENRKYLARLVIAGTARPMDLPQETSLSTMRLPSLTSVTPGPTVTYEINLSPLRFQIDGRSYTDSHVRPLDLGKTEEWTLTSGGQAQANHPFHIHVNPFEIVSIRDSNNVERLTERFGGPVWKDSVLVEYGSRVKIRTHYKRFTGKFVQHCHILQHEDLGMMELVEIREPVSPRGNGGIIARGSGGTPSDLARAKVMLFIQGASCPHCLEQVKTFSKSLAGYEAELVVVSASADDVQGLNALSSNVIGDADLATFRRFGVTDKSPRHAVIVLDKRGQEVFRRVTDAPSLNVNEALAPLASRAATRLRRSIDDPAFDLATYLDAFRRLKAAPSNQMQSYEALMRLHNGGLLPNGRPGGCIHNHENFLPWHRILLAQFEKALRETDPPRTSNVTLPYWDFSQPATGRRFPRAFEDQASVLWHANRFNLTAMSSPQLIALAQQREASRASIMASDNLEALFSRDRYWTNQNSVGFATALESSPHNWMHTPFTMGDMQNDQSAARDAIFWSFHCYLDLMWYQWQVRHNAFEGASPSLLPSDLTVIYDHFAEPVTIGQSLRPENLGYTYVASEPSPLIVNLSPRAAGGFAWQNQGDTRTATNRLTNRPKGAVLKIPEFQAPTDGSWLVELFLHPKDVQPAFADPEFRKQYFAGQHAEWRGAHRPAREGAKTLLIPIGPKKVAVSRTAKREYTLSLNFVPLATDTESNEAEAVPKKVAIDFKNVSVIFD